MVFLDKSLVGAYFGLIDSFANYYDVQALCAFFSSHACILIKIMGTLQTAFLSRVSSLVFGIKYFNQKLICALVLFSLFGIIKVFLWNGRPFY